MLVILPVQVMAQQGGGGSPKKLSQEALAQLLAPIALYPDELVSQILMASTYPLEVVQADRWVKSHKQSAGEVLAKQLEKEPWDPSVKSLVNFPVVLASMSEKLDVTTKIGDAFLAQQKDVMDTIQLLRKKAYEAGNLKTSKEQKVVVEKEIIIIQPADPQVIYVPTYSPTVVYGVWMYPSYPPYYYYPPPPPPPPPPPGYPPPQVMHYATGVAVGVAWGYAWGHADWHGGQVNYNVNQNINVNRNIDRSKYQNKVDHRGSGKWQHNPEHRKGVAYRDNATRDKYSPTNRAAVDNRKNYRGYDQKGAGVADRTSGRQQAQVQDRKSDRGGSGTKSQGNAFGGVDRGAQVKQDSARGRESLSSAQRSGGGSSGSWGGSSGGSSRGGGGSRGSGGGRGGGGGRGRR
jgi:uncharacterized membrane protein YgcG